MKLITPILALALAVSAGAQTSTTPPPAAPAPATTAKPAAKPAAKAAAPAAKTAATTGAAAKSTATTAAKTTATTVHKTTAAAAANALPANIPVVKGVKQSLYSLRYIDISVGSGPLATPSQLGKSQADSKIMWYTVHYTGYLAKDGTKFDSSVDRGSPITFPYGVGKVIPGWDTGFEGMHIGGKRRLFVPYQLAYGASGRPPVIPAKADLIFDVELIGISDKPPAPPESAKPADSSAKPGESAKPGDAAKPSGTATPAAPAAKPAAPAAGSTPAAPAATTPAPAGKTAAPATTTPAPSTPAKPETK